MRTIKETVGKLKGMRAGDAAVRSVFNYLREFESEDAIEMEVKRVANGAFLATKDVREVFSKLERLRLGRLILGRQGGQTRFKWLLEDWGIRSWKAIVPGRQPGEPDVVDESEVLGELEDSDHLLHAESNVWVIKLGGGRRRVATLIFPRGMDRKELDKVIKFCQRHRSASP